MKKHILTFLSLISFTVIGQSLSIAPADYYYSTAGETCTAHFDVVNESNQDLAVIVTRTMDPADAITSTFCWGETCYTPTTDVSLNSIVIPAGESFDGFSGYLYSMAEEASFVINYCFAVEDNPTDKVCADVTYTSLSQYIDLKEVEDEFSVYPNPASDRVQIKNNSLNEVSFVLYDMLGNKMQEKQLKGDSFVDVSSFESGIYFYTFATQGKVSEVQKLIVAH